MKSVILGFLILLTANNVWAVAAYDYLIQQRNSTNTSYGNSIPPSPLSGDGLFFFNQATHGAIWLAPGNFTNVGGTLYAKPVANDITDATSVGKTLLTSASTGAALSSLDGVSNTSLTSTLSNYPTNSAMSTAMSGKMDNPSGTAAQYVSGTGSLLTSKTALSQFTNDSGFMTTVSWADVTGKPTIDKSYVGLGNVDNTSDANKPISSATQTALNLKSPINSPAFTGTVTGISKAMVGLGNADDTSDANKPVSTATQTAINLKAPIASPTFTGTVSGISKAMVGLGSVDDTSDSTKNSATATLTNKSISGSANTMTNIPQSAVTGLTTDLAGKFASPSGTTSQYVRGDGSLATLPTAPSRSFSYSTRSLNTCFQPSSTRDALVSYSVDILTTISLTTGQQGTVYLRTYTDSGCTTGAQEVVRFVNGQTGALTIGLNISQNVTASLTGIIPAGLWVKLVTENNTSTPTFTARPGQEVLL